MDLLNTLENNHHKASTLAIVDYIVANPTAMSTLMDLFLNGHYRINQRAAWPLGIIGESHPHIITPFLGQLVENLEKENLHDAVIRNTLRTFQKAPITDEIEGPLYEMCFGFLLDMKRPVAIKAFSMTVLGRIAHKFPELKAELISVIEDQYEHGSAGFQARARTVLKKLKT